MFGCLLYPFFAQGIVSGILYSLYPEGILPLYPGGVPGEASLGTGYYPESFSPRTPKRYGVVSFRGIGIEGIRTQEGQKAQTVPLFGSNLLF